MEPVPETERMEEFKPSPVPSVRLGIANPSSHQLLSNGSDACATNGNPVRTAVPPTLDLDMAGKPPTLRRSTDPNPSSPVTPSWTPSSIPYRPRTASPLSGSHPRSGSAAAPGLALPMSRAQSMPGLGASGRILYSPQLRPASPSGSPGRVRAPRRPVDEVFPPSSPVRTSVLDAEPRPASAAADRSSSPSQAGSALGSLARHRRPSSPLRGFALPSSSSLSLLPSTPSSSSTSPSPFRAYDASFGGSLSSVPSTPTSARSRSPSISSLETIPDSPDAEEAAVEAERLARLKAAADAAEGTDPADAKARNTNDVPARGRTMSFGPRDKRKRWSVCGAERRGDLDLETIWED
ncbi:hypothetical protein CDD83_9994 [Cordyceps sp. RAO-2017]|nr:hypothetical protein CDD83_9994 [Cordyceps sp. RAO-2017]